MSILLNSARCSRCGDVLSSTYTHDFVTCSCGSLSVDGGRAYLKRCFDGEYEELSVYSDDHTDEVMPMSGFKC